MSRRRHGIMAAWFREAAAQHQRELGAPQPFALTGDNVHMDALRHQGGWDAGKIADARYRDWLIQRERNL